MIHVFHGFLGSPADFDFLPRREDLVLHDLHDEGAHALVPHPGDTLIGYSMGGRLALELAARVDFKLKKLVLINAHGGLSGEAQKKDRKAWEDAILAKMCEDGFMNYWNSLPVFAHDRPLQERASLELKASMKLFNRLRLSDQPDFLPLIAEHQDKVLWIIGEQDQKYHDWARSELSSRKIPYAVIPGGHRLFQNPRGLLQVLTSKGVL